MALSPLPPTCAAPNTSFFTTSRACRWVGPLKEGVLPRYRPKDWQIEARKKQKKEKRYEWSTKGGYIAPIFVPASPGGVLTKQLKEVARNEAKQGIRFKIVETGGRTLKSELQRSNPTASPGCGQEGCIGCSASRGEGGDSAIGVM